MESIRERVALYMAKTGATKTEIADALGVTRQTLHSKLSGETDFKLSEAEKLATMIGCSVDDLRISPTK